MRSEQLTQAAHSTVREHERWYMHLIYLIIGNAPAFFQKKKSICFWTVDGDDANVKWYFAWSLFDNFEWRDAFTVRFGINFVDYNDVLKRYTKDSARWFKEMLQK
jgi:hypothetical protein